MGSDIKAFGANRLIAGAAFLLFAGLVSLVFLPGAVDYMANAELHGRISFFNGWEPRHRLFAGFTMVGLFALAALVYLRLLIDNRLVFVGSEGIEVRHPLGTQRALWRDFAGIKPSKLIRGYFYLTFKPGQDSEGRKMTRKVRLPAPMLGVDLKAVLVETTVHTMMRAANEAGFERPPEEFKAVVREAARHHLRAQPATRTFGRRRA